MPDTPEGWDDEGLPSDVLSPDELLALGRSPDEIVPRGNDVSGLSDSLTRNSPGEAKPSVLIEAEAAFRRSQSDFVAAVETETARVRRLVKSHGLLVALCALLAAEDLFGAGRVLLLVRELTAEAERQAAAERAIREAPTEREMLDLLHRHQGDLSRLQFRALVQEVREAHQRREVAALVVRSRLSRTPRGESDG